jgi:hypothetical protein
MVVYLRNIALSHNSLGLFWVTSEISGGYNAETLFLSKVQPTVELETVRVPNYAEGLFSDFRLFSIAGLPEWDFWRYLSGYRMWTAALMPVQMVGIVQLVVDPEYIWGKEEAASVKLVEDGIKLQRESIKYYAEFAEYISAKLVLLCLAYEPFLSSDEKLIGSVPPEVHVLKYNLQEDFDFVKDFRVIFRKDS